MPCAVCQFLQKAKRYITILDQLNQLDLCSGQKDTGDYSAIVQLCMLCRLEFIVQTFMMHQWSIILLNGPVFSNRPWTFTALKCDVKWRRGRVRRVWVTIRRCDANFTLRITGICGCKHQVKSSHCKGFYAALWLYQAMPVLINRSWLRPYSFLWIICWPIWP